MVTSVYPYVHMVSEIQARQDFKGLAHCNVKSRSYHDDAHLHPQTNVLTKHQLPTPYGCQDRWQDIAWTRFSSSRSLWQGERSNHGHTIMLYTYTPSQWTYQVSTFHTLQILGYCPNKILKVKVTTARSTAKSRSHHDDAHP